ncbi:MAG: DUF3363 domain-containing protein [Rhizobiaceae bacterium]
MSKWEEEENSSIRYRQNLLFVLQQRELQASGNQIAKESNSFFVHTSDGERLDGIYNRSVNLASDNRDR